jgi:hypothetical protein
LDFHVRQIRCAGPTGKNPNSESPKLEVEFEKGSHPIVFPSSKEIRDFAEFIERVRRRICVITPIRG